MGSISPASSNYLQADRCILHVDMNHFYANVEELHHPELRGKALIVGGNQKERHGIVLTKNPLAKAAGVKTGEPLVSALKKCPQAVVLPPNYPLYMRFSKMARKLYYEYTDKVEPFGLDEAWLDISNSLPYLKKSALDVAQEIASRIRFELGISASIGVSWNKIFAKFGSDYKKPNGLTRITRSNYKKLVWKAPVKDLLYVGSATHKKLLAYGITTIGQLACADSAVLSMRLGCMGLTIQNFARGLDYSPVMDFDPRIGSVHYQIKSVGNALTAPHDLLYQEDTKALLFLLCESVAQRLRELKLESSCICIHCRSSETLSSYSRQRQLKRSTNISSEIMKEAWLLLKEHEPMDGSHPLRSLGVQASALDFPQALTQLDIFNTELLRDKRRKLDSAIDDLRRRFGNKSIVYGAELVDPDLAHIDIKDSNVVHPVGYFCS